MDLTGRTLFRDAGKGIVVTGRLLRGSLRRPEIPESSDWRGWLYPAYVAVIALMPLVGAAQGYIDWPEAVVASVAIGVVAVLLLARLARRYYRDHPEI